MLNADLRGTDRVKNMKIVIGIIAVISTFFSALIVSFAVAAGRYDRELEEKKNEGDTRLYE